ncbi:MAG: N-acetylmuramoyl-L-alanine amidase [Bacteroidetes bacterium]|nr:MAG: N-acetylmuramoyl-L-alanine amidase [Bacteroidota bacterium]
MKDKSIIILLLILVFSSDNQLFSQSFFNIDKIVIDAGHGGKDPGTIGKHSKEKAVALSIALKLGDLIKNNLKDVDVIYTRDKDVFVELYRRAEIANQAKADLFISIHCNSINSTRAKGTETWIMGNHRSAKNLEVAKKENAAILLESDYSKNYNNFDPNSAESYITFSLIQNAYREQSMQLAESVQNQFENRVHRINRGVKEAGFLVLVYTTMPSILIETGFLSNPEEEKFLLSEQGQDYIASAIYRAFKGYKNSIEANNNVANEAVLETNISKQTEVVNENNDSINDVSVFFGVQFMNSTNSLNTDNEFKNIKDVWYYKQGGLYKYVSGKYTSFNKASKAKKEVKANGFKDSFVVSFINGERVSRREAESKLNEIK